MVQRFISFGGGVFLLFIGGNYIIQTIRGRIQLPESEPSIAPRSTPALLGLGVLATISNPFWYTWWVTIAAGYLGQAGELGLASVAAFYLGHISADFGWDTTLSIATSTGARWLTDRMYRLLILITGGFMLYLGGVFLTNSGVF
jgi:threonine/homoserine/homoserine lactone efflux protein